MYLDPQSPILRQKELLKSSRTSVIIADTEEGIFGWKLVSKLTIRNTHKLFIFQQNVFQDTISSISPEWNIAYVIHTSGSTGTPKAVRVPHSCVLPNILDLRYFKTNCH